MTDTVTAFAIGLACGVLLALSLSNGLCVLLWLLLTELLPEPEVVALPVHDIEEDDWGADDYLLASASSFDFWDNEIDAEWDNEPAQEDQEALLKWGSQ